MPLPSEQERESWTNEQRAAYDHEMGHYRELADKIIKQNAGKFTEDQLKRGALGTIAEITDKFPDGDPKIVNSFMASMATVMGMLLHTSVKDVTDVMEHIFDLNMLAVAHNLGAIDLTDSAVDEKIKAHIKEAEEREADESQAMTTLDDIIGRQYL